MHLMIEAFLDLEYLTSSSWNIEYTAPLNTAQDQFSTDIELLRLWSYYYH